MKDFIFPIIMILALFLLVVFFVTKPGIITFNTVSKNDYAEAIKICNDRGGLSLIAASRENGIDIICKDGLIINDYQYVGRR